MKKKEKKERMYSLELTERQAKLLSYACDQFLRLICGQGFPYQQLFEDAWEKRCKEVTGKSMDSDFEGGWHNMREEAEEICAKIKQRFWGCAPNAHYGIRYDETADILFDIHQVIRHQIWEDKPEDKKDYYTVDSAAAMRFGDEPLAVIKRIK